MANASRHQHLEIARKMFAADLIPNTRASVGGVMVNQFIESQNLDPADFSWTVVRDLIWLARCGADEYVGRYAAGEKSARRLIEEFWDSQRSETASEDETESDEPDQQADAGRGWLYVACYSHELESTGRIAIKIGITIAQSAEQRVAEWARGTGCPSAPSILAAFELDRVRHIESAVHSILKARNAATNGGGTEWFLGKREDVLSAVRSVILLASAAS